VELGQASSLSLPRARTSRRPILLENFVIGDSLSAAIRSRLPHVGTFDVVVGNPPWGGVYDGINAAAVLAELAYLHLTLNGIRGRYLSSYVGSH